MRHALGDRSATALAARALTLSALLLGRGIAAPPSDDDGPGSRIFDMRQPGSVPKPEPPPAATQPAPDAAPTTGPAPAAATSAPAPPTVAPPRADRAGTIQPIPPAAALAEAAKRVADAYAAEIAAAAQATDARLSLAGKMLQSAADEADPTNVFALLDIARDTAAGAGDLRLACHAVDVAAARFAVDGPKLKASAAAVTLRMTLPPMAHRYAVLRAAALSEQLAALDRSDLTGPLDAAVQAAAATLADPAIAAGAKAAVGAHLAAHAAAAALARQRAVLRASPRDPIANEAVGRHECLDLDDWAAGLPHLAAGADALLRAAALADLGNPTTADARIAVGDAWRAAAKPAPTPAHNRLLARAAHWYAVAAPDATGLAKAKLAGRQHDVAPAPDAAVPSAPRLVDLLALTDPARDAVDGTWAPSNSDLACGAASYTRIEFPYRPPREYDCRIVFTRTSGTDAIDLICCGGGDGTPGSGRQFRFTLGGWGNTVAAFSCVDGHGALDNPTTARGTWLVTGRRQALVVRVRADHVEALLDDRPIATLKTDACRDLALDADVRLHRFDAMGLQAWESAFLIHSADLVELTGRGQPVRPGDPVDVPTQASVTYASPGNHGRPAAIVMLADGRLTSETGQTGLWYQHGTTITFQWGTFRDVCHLSANRRSFQGRNQHGDRIAGSLTGGSL